MMSRLGKWVECSDGVNQSAPANTMPRNAANFIILQVSWAGDIGEMEEDRRDVESAPQIMLVLYQVAIISK
jgi:hypothetical protein